MIEPVRISIGFIRIRLFYVNLYKTLTKSLAILKLIFFFILQSCVEIVALTATAAATGCAFYNIDKTAGLLFVPYLAWLSFATFLNYSVYKMNPKAIEDKKPEEAKK